MGCGCNKGRAQFEVVLADGKVAFSGTSRPAAEGVAKRYPGSTVRQANTNNDGKSGKTST